MVDFTISEPDFSPLHRLSERMREDRIIAEDRDFQERQRQDQLARDRVQERRVDAEEARIKQSEKLNELREQEAQLVVEGLSKAAEDEQVKEQLEGLSYGLNRLGLATRRAMDSGDFTQAAQMIDGLSRKYQGTLFGESIEEMRQMVTSGDVQGFTDELGLAITTLDQALGKGMDPLESIRTEIAALDLERKQGEVVKEEAAAEREEKQGRDQAQSLLNAIESMLQNESGSNALFGTGIGGSIERGTTMLRGATPQRNAARSNLNFIKNNLTLGNLTLLKGPTSDKDIKFVESASTQLQEDMQQDDARRILQGMKEDLIREWGVRPQSDRLILGGSETSDNIVSPDEF